ncbi:unnamed protein product [Spirodela intermedia]|uniref:Uncharacterized protein n=1 Tax=Spirodela intermedia TaxID=51605 RepID=A0A7I8II73_SPIIN|nr:unnamed protein product [Spirodela intermedia]CAA6657561.1 unnamed protein product [Spirodela intermedia]
MRQILPPRLPVVAAGNGSNSATAPAARAPVSSPAFCLGGGQNNAEHLILGFDGRRYVQERQRGGTAALLRWPVVLRRAHFPRLSHSGGSSLFSGPLDRRPLAPPPPTPHMSATALLQKAAQMGATASNSSLLRSFGLVPSSSSASQQHPHDNPGELPVMARATAPPPGGAGGIVAGAGPRAPLRRRRRRDAEFHGGPAAVLRGEADDAGLFRLGMGPGGAAAGGLSALITSIGGSLERATDRSEAWDGADRPPAAPPCCRDRQDSLILKILLFQSFYFVKEKQEGDDSQGISALFSQLPVHMCRLSCRL